jgi:hypothetical protein
MKMSNNAHCNEAQIIAACDRAAQRFADYAAACHHDADITDDELILLGDIQRSRDAALLAVAAIPASSRETEQAKARLILQAVERLDASPALELVSSLARDVLAAAA